MVTDKNIDNNYVVRNPLEAEGPRSLIPHREKGDDVPCWRRRTRNSESPYNRIVTERELSRVILFEEETEK